MKLIAISSSTSIDNEAEIITRLFEMGLPTFHIRNHKLSTRGMKKLLYAIPEKYHKSIVIHSHHNLAFKFKLKGIHLTKSHKRKKFQMWLLIKLLKFFNPSLTISTSYTTIAQLLEYNHRNFFQYDYVFLSPVFDTFSNKFQGGFTESSLKVAVSKTELDVIARGGIDTSTIKSAMDIGFFGVALYSSLWKRKDAVFEFKAIVDKFKELAIPIE